MIGLDTNVLLRLFVEDDPAQSDRARRFVNAAAADEPCIVNPVVLAEFAWTLARNFKINRKEVARLIEGLLSMDDLQVPFRHAAEGALDAYRGGKADFPDYFLAAINARARLRLHRYLRSRGPRSSRLFPRAVSPHHAPIP